MWRRGDWSLGLPSSLNHARLRDLIGSQKQEASISDKESGTPASPFIRFLPTARLRNLGATWTSCVTQGGNLTCVRFRAPTRGPGDLRSRGKARRQYFLRWCQHFLLNRRGVTEGVRFEHCKSHQADGRVALFHRAAPGSSSSSPEPLPPWEGCVDAVKHPENKKLSKIQ